GELPAFAQCAPSLPYLRSGASGQRRLRIGAGAQIVNLQCEPTHKLVALLAGDSRITVVPPDNMADMYPAPLESCAGEAIVSRIPLLQFDARRFPCAVRQLAKGRVAELHPGEVLYIPPLWWHHVESNRLTVTIDAVVPPVSRTQLDELTVNLIRGILAYGELPQSLRLRYRAFYHEVLFGEPAPQS